uniref:DUF1640 domain-containing protein n=1 Tax=Candidatus Kentrum sp. MB TaxID=2138164 RepID=A0A451BBM0_9GAMM|nr:MAG: hypothetical protein BECKMB1821G_GA0114241_102812 [Candidatus Kentron sp. MB]VFK32033.1 MAG: hypothetical protein BECKMB1821I_GA0114274_102911 [Candidatus Kentron sp. MB]VFK75672.1 MAG: hypothetical protein BECKMB1821H_GA0114242_102837 [Candidatus Kentron sp. MB]
MSAITFDTLAFVETLKEAQFNEQQAQAIARAFKDAQHESKVTTKTDIRQIDNKIDKLRSEMREMELRLTIKMGAMIASAIIVIVAIDRFLQIPA